jgi:stage IV sporulation protein FB
MLSFRLLGIPVSIGPAIVVGLLLLGLLSRFSQFFLIAWVVLGIVALLAHELGHALVFRRFAVPSSIRFFVLGGLTVAEDGAAAERLSQTRQALVALAGPAVSMAIGFASLALFLVVDQLALGVPFGARGIAYLWLFVNLGWGVFNLIPIASLDGGQALRHLLGAALPGRAGVALGVGANLLAAALLAAIALQVGQPYIAFIAIAFGLVNPALYMELADALDPSRARRREAERAKAPIPPP